MPSRFTRHRHYLTALHDLFMAGASFLLALYLRLGDLQDFVKSQGGSLLPELGLCLFVCLIVFVRMRLYNGLWRYASLPDLIALTKAATISILLFYLVLFLHNRLESIPRSLPFIQWLLLLALLGAPRFLYRLWRDHKLGLKTSLTAAGRIPVILVGAGDRAELFLRDTRSGASAQYVVVAILDDSPARIGRTMHNVRIYGPLGKLSDVVQELQHEGITPQRVILTQETMDGAKVRGLLEVSEKLGLTLGRLPQLSEFKQGVKSAVEIRPIAVEDLLGRAQNVHDKTPVQQAIAGKVVLITGAGGSIGSELARQVASFAPSRLVLFEHSEYALYQIDIELARLFPEVPRVPVMGDVRSGAQLEVVFTREKPAVVFHAAAIKHVPLAESNPEETILTNMFGTQAVADICAKTGVQVMVLISTDKAVNPSSVMGATKRAAESYCQALAADAGRRGPTRFVAVRFGNVLGSTGSVVPLFQAQLARGGPITVTHPDMTRYFMTIREAVELVLQTITLQGRNGEVYVLDMGQSVRIVDLAEQMIRLAGLVPGKDIKIEFTGLRPGEKMYEELFHGAEDFVRTTHEGIWLASPRYVALDALLPLFSKLYMVCMQRKSAAACEFLHELVPEYKEQ